MLPMEIMMIVILILFVSIYPVRNLMIGLELGEIKSYLLLNEINYCAASIYLLEEDNNLL